MFGVFSELTFFGKLTFWSVDYFSLYPFLVHYKLQWFLFDSFLFTEGDFGKLSTWVDKEKESLQKH